MTVFNQLHCTVFYRTMVTLHTNFKYDIYAMI